MRMFFVVLVIVIAGYVYVTSDGEPVVASGEPIVTLYPTQTPTTAPSLAITAQATITPTVVLNHGEPQRMRFTVGTFGTSAKVEGQQTFVLWAGAGQTLRLAGGSGLAARLTAPSDDDVALVDGAATLPASGDYLLTVAGVEQFSIDIR